MQGLVLSGQEAWVVEAGAREASLHLGLHTLSFTGSLVFLLWMVSQSDPAWHLLERDGGGSLVLEVQGF